MPERQINISLTTRLRIWRAKLAIPVLLSRFEEKKVVSWIAAINGGLAILVIMLAAWISDCPLIFPALGPSAFIMFSTPLSSAAAPRNVIVGHFAAMASGFSVWHLVSYLAGASVTLETGGWPLLCSVSLAMAVGGLLLVRLSCPHASALGSSMIVALGGVPHWLELLYMALAVTIITFLAVAMNRAASLPVPLWKESHGQMEHGDPDSDVDR